MQTFNGQSTDLIAIFDLSPLPSDSKQKCFKNNEKQHIPQVSSPKRQLSHALAHAASVCSSELPADINCMQTTRTKISAIRQLMYELCSLDVKEPGMNNKCT